jgi:hypothetical protein
MDTDIVKGKVTGLNTNTLRDQSNLCKLLKHEYVKFINKYS